MVGQIISEIANKRNNIKVGKINGDEQPELAQQFGIMSVPMICIIKDVKVVNQMVGARPKEDIIAML